ncbi:Voltage-dependent calcium channel subunit alpha-2/delta-3 [Gossypium australe]|uniref:Voltage-dependent calcium channel subunit alpha-2/delta-3 n=1 Tax=Gossypium australe TaxID=47621 RepID=A0A5B6VZK4_9ROSI|nr:Voltage-dependent calcium channel subunit alpha-2/delta-3 [Gossypium australe]
MAGMGSLAEEVVRTDGCGQSLSFQPPSLAYTRKSEVKISELPELNKDVGWNYAFFSLCFFFSAKIQNQTTVPTSFKLQKRKVKDTPSVMSHSGDSPSLVTAEEGYDTEFRSYPDDAWYSVQLLLEGERSEKLRVKYDEFPAESDNVFLADNFKSKDELHDFLGRFRKVSAQLQDPNCSKVVKGMRVCASDSFAAGEVLFYDAIVDDVLRKKHSNLNGQEECECIFLLFWLHGPNVGNLTNKGVADICLLQDSELHPKLIYFMEISMQNIVQALPDFVSGTTSDDLVCNTVARLRETNGRPLSGSLRQGDNCCYVSLFIGKVCSAVFERSVVTPRFVHIFVSINAQFKSIHFIVCNKGVLRATVIGGNCDNRQDTDVGGDKKLYVILVQNLEKDLSSSAVSKFIHEQTSIATQVYIFPSLPWEPYTNGVIMMDCKKDVEQLFGFLQSPDQFAVSSNGRSSIRITACRPLVATEKLSLDDHWTLMLKSPNKLLNRWEGGFSGELKVVCCGTEEYKKAKELRDLFLQFIDHQKRLYKKLCMEETSLLYNVHMLYGKEQGNLPLTWTCIQLNPSNQF